MKVRSKNSPSEGGRSSSSLDQFQLPVVAQVAAGLRSGDDLMGAAGRGPHVCMSPLPEKPRRAGYAAAA